MDNTNSNTLRILPAVLGLLFCLLAHNAKAAATSYYFDVNGTTTGSGVTSGGTFNWENSPGHWNTDSTGAGGGAISDWVDGGFPVFSAGTDANTYSYTNNIGSGYTHVIAGMQATSTGTVTINGPGTLNIASGVQGFSSSGTLTINAALGGSGGYEIQSGIVCLYGNNTFSGGCLLNGAQTYFNSANSFGGVGGGAITPIYVSGTPPGYSALLATGGSLITLPNNFVISTANAGLNFASSASTPVTCTGTWDLQQTLYLRNNGNSTAPLTLSGVLSDVGGLTVSANNSGTILLSGANNYSGGTTISMGTTGVILQVGNASALGSGAATVASGCVLDLNGTSGVNINHTLTLNGTGISSGGALINSSATTAASLASGTSVTLGSAIFIGGTANGTYDITINGTVSGSALLTMVGKNPPSSHIPTLTLNGANTSFSGGITIDYSTVAVGNSGFTGTINLNDAPATFQASGTSPLSFGNALTLGASTTANPPTPACIFGAPGTGNLTFSGAANSGTSNDKTIAANGITVTFSGVIGGATTAHMLGFAGGTANGNTPAPGPGTIVLAAANTYTKTNVLFSGTVQVAYAENANTSGPLGKAAATSAGNIVFNGGTLQYSSANHNDYSGRFSTLAGQVYNTGGQLYNIDVNGQPVTFATGLNSGGTGTLTLSDSAGNGKLTLTAANSYSGATTINGGTLALSGSGSISSSATITVGAGATFDVSGVTSSPYQVLTGQTLNGGGATATVNGALTLNSGALLTLNYASGTPTINVTGGALTLNNNTTTITVSGSPLGVASYKLISKGTGGSVAGTVSSATVNVANRAANTTASLQILSGELYLNVNCVNSADPTSASASPATICNGGSTTLTLSGGGGGSDETVKWYTGSCGGTLAATGNGASVSPTTTTTYYGRYEDGSPCNYNSACQSVTVTVNQQSGSPASASASPATICNGGSTTLTLNGGGGGTGETIKWYTGSCGGTLAATGNGASVSPTTTTTYYGRYEDGSPCNYNSACAQVTVTVNTKSADPTSASASAATICGGGSTTLTLHGGGGGTGETVKWYTGSCGGTLAATGNNVSVSPTTTTTYYGRYEDGSPCSYNSACAQVSVTVNPAPTASAISGATGSVTPVAIGQMGSVYSVTPANGSSSYAWTVPAGASFTGGGTASITVNWGTASSGNVSVTETTSANCVGTPVSLGVTVSLTNHAPTAQNFSLNAQGGSAVRVEIIGGKPAYAATDPDSGDTLTVAAVSSTAHAIVTTDGTAVTYTALSTFTGADSFTYTVSDGNGGTAVGTVSVTVTANTGLSPNVVSGPIYSNGMFSVTFAGIPDTEYTIEYTTAFPPSSGWTKLQNVTAGDDGLFVVEDDVSQSPSRYYRTVYPSY